MLTYCGPCNRFSAIKWGRYRQTWGLDEAGRSAQVEKPIELPVFQAQQRIQELPTLLEQDDRDAKQGILVMSK